MTVMSWRFPFIRSIRAHYSYALVFLRYISMYPYIQCRTPALPWSARRNLQRK